MTKRGGYVLAAVAATLFAVPAAAYDEMTVSDGGRIEGVVSYRGPVPTTRIIPTKDREVCGEPRDQPAVLLGAGQQVQDAVVYLKAMARGKPWGAPPTAPRLDNRQCRFEPPIQVMRPGAIEIHNSDPVLHNTHGFYGRRTAFNVALPTQGMQVTSELPRPGMVRVECDAHGWMLGHVLVADSPYYALTAKDGRFSLADIPPGDYTLVASQYYLGDTETPVTVKAGATTTLAIEMKKK